MSDSTLYYYYYYYRRTDGRTDVTRMFQQQFIFTILRERERVGIILLIIICY